MDLMSIAIDPSKEIQGAKVEIDRETSLVVARYNNKEFRKLQAKLMDPYIRTAGQDGVTTEQAEEILATCLAETVLLGWEGLKLAGEEVPYSTAKAKELLQDPRFIDFKEIVMIQSQMMENYRLEALEEDLGNSEGSLDTAQDGA